MKRIISFLLILCLFSALFGCNNVSEVTETEQGTTGAGTVITDTETAEDTETEPYNTTEETAETAEETAKETDADTEPAPGLYGTYTIYDPAMAGDGRSGCSLTLLKNGRYSLELKSFKNSLPLYKVILEYGEEGEYEIDENVGEIILSPSDLTYFIETDKNDEYKSGYLTEIEESYSSGDISKEAYAIINKATEEPYSTTDVVSFKAARVFGSAIANGANKALLDGTTAYFMINGLELSENEYYIAENGYTLALHDDKTCGMSTNTERSGGDIGVILVHETYSGTYEKNGNDVRCIITKNTTRYEFLSEDDRSEFVEFYTAEYEKGRINKVYYNYYMALISEEGYVTDELSDVYLITTEPHTHTAFITGSPESEA